MERNQEIDDDQNVKDRELRRRMRLEKFKSQVVHLSSERRVFPVPVAPVPTPTMVTKASPSNEARLAAIAVNLNVRLRSADMPGSMQERAFRCSRALLDSSDLDHEKRPNPTRLASFLKKEFDGVYGPAWHCIVGKSFGSYVTHSSGGFVYFSVDKLCFLLFKTEVQPVKKEGCGCSWSPAPFNYSTLYDCRRSYSYRQGSINDFDANERSHPSSKLPFVYDSYLPDRVNLGSVKPKKLMELEEDEEKHGLCAGFAKCFEFLQIFGSKSS